LLIIVIIFPAEPYQTLIKEIAKLDLALDLNEKIWLESPSLLGGSLRAACRCNYMKLGHTSKDTWQVEW